MLYTLLYAGNVGAGFIVFRLGPVEVFVAFLVAVPKRFQRGFEVNPLSEVFLQLKFGVTDARSGTLKLLIKGLPPQHRQFGLFTSLFVFVGLVLLSGLGLPLKVL
jgi:hypothetical protein